MAYRLHNFNATIFAHALSTTKNTDINMFYIQCEDWAVLLLESIDIPSSLHDMHQGCGAGAVHSGVRRKFNGDFIQWHMVVICIWCTPFVMSQFEVI